jgi:ribitol-5-phosphate 2-dehydrogenase (NADP+) / D-ribitol-5-phosphate cytidylyltransferase
MKKTVETTAIILAGGQGVRLEQNTPKQFLKIAGKTVLEHTIEIFDKHDGISHIIVGLDPIYHKEWSKKLEMLNLKTPITFSPSGRTRNLTTKLAVQNCNNPDFVLIHDSVRPMLQANVITECIENLKNFDAVAVAIPPAETVIEIDKESMIRNIPNRSNLMLSQTPQGFRFQTIKKAYELFDEVEDKNMTDDCAVVSKYCPGSSIKAIPGSFSNIKVTRPLDLYIVDALFKIRTTDVQHFSLETVNKQFEGKIAVIVGGSSGIGMAISDLLKLNGAIVEVLSRGSTGTDVKEKEHLEIALKRIKAVRGQIDFVIMSAGIMHSIEVVKQNAEEIHEILDTNLLGVINVAKASFEYLKESKGHLLVIGSSAWSRGRANQAVYSASKAAAVNFAQAISEEWYNDKIRVNVMNPGRTETPLWVRAFGNESANNLLDPRKVAEECLKILSTTATGQIFQIEPRS